MNWSDPEVLKQIEALTRSSDGLRDEAQQQERGLEEATRSNDVRLATTAKILQAAMPVFTEMLVLRHERRDPSRYCKLLMAIEDITAILLVSLMEVTPELMHERIISSYLAKVEKLVDVLVEHKNARP